MEKIRDNFNDYVSELDEMLYYNEEDLKRQIYEYETKEARKKGLEEGRKEGRKEGRIEGKREATLELAKKFKELNISAKEISEATGLSIKEINNL